MKFLILSVCLAFAAADVSHLVHSHGTDAEAPIVRSAYDITPDGAFQFTYETANGIVAGADGVLKDPNSPNAALEVKGGYKYTSPEGALIDTSYVANENGYQPQGTHLPVPPPIPELILRSLEYIRAHPYVENTVNIAPTKYYKN